jgi:hypothetical protein
VRAVVACVGPLDLIESSSIADHLILSLLGWRIRGGGVFR